MDSIRNQAMIDSIKLGMNQYEPIGGMNRSVNVEFGCSELLLPRITPSIPELARPAYII
jgi:hypothetical protein